MKLPKADSTLNNLVDRVESGEITAEEAAEEAPLHRGESVGVIIILSGNVEGVAAFLKANRASNINAGDDYIEAFVPILLLGQTSEQPGVLLVNQIQPPGETQGTPQVTGQGPGVHGSGPWNDAGYAGQGVKVGVIDRGFSGYAEIMDSEVPATVEARCYIWLGQHSQDPADCSDAGTHGTIVSESVMDIAPEAALYISDPQSLSELRDAVDWMISEGVSVINHSRLWSFDGPGDGTSPLSISPLNSIDRAVAAGIVWVNAAGNQALGTWFKRGPFDYTTVNIDGEGIRFLRFTGSEIRNKEAYIGGRLELRWEDDWGGAETDLDLFALVTGTDTIALQSIDIQSGGAGHNPYEWIGSLSTYDIVVAHRGGPEPDWVQLVGWGPTRLTLNSSGAGSITNPAESANPAMLAVGAAPWYNVNVLSGFSSRGPTPDGRIKPDVVAANCGPTATGGEGFCGTSQSSPHVAGMAALVWQRYPDYTPAQVASYLKENAEQRTSPDPNSNWGHGFFVLPPLTQPPPSPTAPGAPGILSLTPGTNSLTVSWRAPLQTGGATITSYDLRHIRSDAPNKADGNWMVVRRVWTGTGGLTHALHSLTGSVQYDVQVRAANSAGDGPWSATRTGTPVSPLAVPGSPIFVTASPGAGSLTVAWGAPPDDGGSAVTSYDLRHIRSDASHKGDANWTVARGVSTGFGALRYSLFGPIGGSRYDVQVRAVNAVGEGTWSATATGTPLVQPVCQDSNVVPNAFTNPQLVSDCETLLALKDTLRGTGTLNWSASVPIRSWTGVRVGGSPLRVSEFRIQGNMTGRIPSELGNLNGLTLLDLSNNQLTGTIPRALGNLPNLRFLYLQSNRLTGDIPAELGNLSSLEVLYLWSNQLAGTIPPQLSRANSLEELSFSDNRIVGSLPSELGSLTTLTSLALARNKLSGSIPAELANLGNLQTLKLSGNQLTGCIPAALRDVLDNDLTGLGLPDCGAATAPGAPTGLAASANGQTQISLSWRAPANDGGGAITGYRIEVSEDRQRWIDQVSNTGSIATVYAHTGLMPGDTRHYRVSALNSAGAGQPSAIATESTAAANVPGAPSVASVTAGKGSLTVTWGAPVQTGGTPVTAYDLRHIRSDAPNKADASWTVVQDVWTGSGALSRELSGLDGGLQYDVQVRAVNSAGDGQWSTTSTGTPEATTAIPAPAANAQYQREGSTAVVTWDPSAAATSYKVYHSDSRFPRCSLFSSGTLSGCDELSASVSGTTYTHTNPDGDNDSYWVTACNAAGCSEIDSANPAQFNDTRPSGPTNAHYRLVSTTAVVSWNPSIGATHYKVYHSDSRFPRCSLFSSGTLSGCDELSASVSGTTYTHTNPDGDNDSYWVTACNAAGCSEIDSANPAQFNDTRPSGPTNAHYRLVGTTAVISWNPPAGATSYKVYHSDLFASNCRLSSGSPSFCNELAGSVTGTSYTHATPHTNMNYYWVTACNASGCSEIDSANPAQFNDTRPSGPTNAHYRLAGTTAVISWNPSAGATSYKVYHSDSRFPRCSLFSSGTLSGCDELSSNVSGTTYTHTNPDGDNDSYWVTACNAAGCSEIANANPARMEGQGPAPDLVVDTLTVSDNAPAAGVSFTLSATAVNQGNDRSDSTTLRYYQSTDSTITTGDTEVGTDRILGLNASASEDESISLTAPSTPGTHYYGACVDSVTDESDTQNNCSSAVTITVSSPAGVPGAPTGLVATADGETDIDLSWTAPSDDGGANITGYRIEVSTNGSNWSDLEANTNLTATSYSHSGLTASSTMHYRVSAINSQGAGAASNVANTTTDAAPVQRTSVCATDGAVPDAANNAGLVSDCETLLAAKSELAGSVFLNWSADTPMSDWEGIIVYPGTQLRRVAWIALEKNLTGTIPGELGNLMELEQLHLGNNKFAGGIPRELGNLSNLTKLTLSHSTLTGAIPKELGNLTNLQTLDISGNQLSGAIPTELGRLGSLTSLRLHENQLSGTIPASLGMIANLQSIVLSNNQLSGSLPSALTTLVQLNTLSIRDNQLTGSIPAGIGNLPRLSRLDLAGNRLSGSLPPELGDLGNLELLYLSSNRLSGDVPSELGKLTKLDGLTLHGNSLTGCVPENLESQLDPSTIWSVGVPFCSASTAPGAPTGLTATADGETEIDLSWSAPSDDGGADITGYKIEVSTNGTSWTDLVANTGTTVITYSHSGLTAGSTRYYRVSAINSEGTGPTSNTDSATTDAAVSPGAPTGLSATADGQTKIDLSWSAPTDDGGANITGYKIEVSTDGSSWSNLVADTGSTSTTYSHTGLAAGSTRHYRVSAINSAGTGTASNTDSATTESDTQTQTEGECVADLRVQLGDNCTYPGTTEEFSVDASGNGQFLFFSSGSKLEIRNSNINGFIYTLVASKQGDGSWLVEEVG